MPIARQTASVLSKVVSGGGSNYGVPTSWSQSMYGSGWPMQPVTAPKDIEIPRSIDFPISVNSTLVPRTGYGLMPFASLLEAYENVAECKSPVLLIQRELNGLVPHLVDADGNTIEDHPYNWMTKSPDRKTPFGVWLTRFIKSTKIYDAPAVYYQRDHNNAINGLHYIDGSTLFVIVDQFGNTPEPEPVADYVQRMIDQQPNVTPSLVNGGITGTSSITDFVNNYVDRQRSGKPVPPKIPAYTQVIKGTPFSWWSADDIWYMPQSRRVNAPYGESFIEMAWSWIMIIVNVTAFELGHYRTGNMPEGFVTVPSSMFGTPDEILAAELMFNKRMTDNPTTERNRIRVFPENSKYFPTKKPDFPRDLYKQAWHNILYAIGESPSDFGDMPGSGLGGKGMKEGSNNDLGRRTLNPHRAFVQSLFNGVLEKDGVKDVKFSLDYALEEIDPDKKRASVYEGMTHGTYSLNDALGQLNMNPVGDPKDPDNLANKHLIVAGSTIYVIEDMETQNGMAVPTFSPTPGGKVGGQPVGPETVVEQDGKEHDPKEDQKTLQRVIRQMQETGTLDGNFISIPSGKILGKSDTTQQVANIVPDGILPEGNPVPHIIQLTKADAVHRDGAMVAVMIPSEVAQQLRQISESLDLPQEAQLETPENMHVTLAFLPDTNAAQAQRGNILDQMASVAAVTDALKGKIQGYGVFNGSGDSKVLFALLDEPHLPFLRTAICNAFDAAGIDYGKDYGFVPHVTMAYLPKDYELPAGFEVPDIPVSINAITLAFGSAFTYLSLKSSEPETVQKSLQKFSGVDVEDDDYYGAPISRERTLIFPEEGHANGVEVVAMTPDGLPPKAALWKPEGGESTGLQNFIGGAQYLREEAAYLLDRSLGFYLVPVAYVAESHDELGTAVMYSPGAPGGKAASEYAPEWIERAAVFDFISGQQDRGSVGHNYLTFPGDDTRPILIDNGMSFPVGDRVAYSGFCSAWLDQPLSESTLSALVLCRGDAAVWSDIGVLVGRQAAQNAISRLQQLLDDKILSLDSGDAAMSSNGSGGL